uniref:Protein Wnt n=1 Tax=Steinernema glaseri TaxID=37863 RepID=A0A1I7ZZR2_9BILA
MCRRITELMPIIINAAKETVFGCAKMFAHRRWNCSSLLAVPYLRNDLTKEWIRLSKYLKGVSTMCTFHFLLAYFRLIQSAALSLYN